MEPNGEGEEPGEEPEAEEGPAREEEGAKHDPKSGAEGEPQAEPKAAAEPPAEGAPEGEKEPEEEPEAEAEAASTPVLRASSTRRIVSVELEADQQSLAHRGQGVEVVLPGGARVEGKVRRLTAVEASGEGSPEESEGGVEATISVAGKHRVPALDGATVSVLFTQRVRRHVLSVPLTALLAIGGGRFAVEAVGAGGGRRRVVVTPGLAADGYVEVAGKGLLAGMRVETGG
jgi:multidrug efflux pump subunit AcrA (membrane-fusion protein)